MPLSRRFLHLLTRREPAAPLQVLRGALAVASLLQLTDLAPALRELARGDVLRTPYLAATPALPSAAIPWVVALWAGSALILLSGWWTRPAAVVLAGVQLGALLYDRQLYSNHFYLLALLTSLLALAGAGTPEPSSEDEAADPRERTVVSWPVVLMRTQITSVYLFAGLSKVNPDFVSGRVLAYYLKDGPLAGREAWLRSDLVVPVAVAVIVTELFLSVGLWTPALRLTAVALGCGLHLSILVALGPTRGLVIFALESLGTYPLFFSHPPLRRPSSPPLRLRPGRPAGE